MSYKQETLEIAKERAAVVADAFFKEVVRLLNSGAVDSEYHSRGLLFGVAIENIADGYLRGERRSKNYKNLKGF